MLDFSFMLWVPVVGRIHPQSNKFAMGVENNTTGDSKLNDSPDIIPTSCSWVSEDGQNNDMPTLLLN